MLRMGISSKLSGYSLSNFKAFGNAQRIEIKPITLLYGKNSSGKSSLIHSLLLLNDLLQRSELKDTHKTVLGEDFVDLGGFLNFAYGKPDFPSKDSRFGPTLAFTFSFTDIEIEGFPEWDVEVRIAASREEGKLHLLLDELNLSSQGQLVLSVKSPLSEGDAIHYPVVFEESSNWVAQVKAEFKDQLLSEKSLFSDFILYHETSQGKFLNFKILTLAEYNVLSVPSTSSEGIEAYDNMISEWEVVKGKTSSLLRNVFGRVDSILLNLKYLGGLRTMPEKSFFDGGVSKQSNPNSGGIAYWEKIRDDDFTLKKVNDWLALLFELESDSSGEEEKCGKYKIVRKKVLNQAQIIRALDFTEDDDSSSAARDLLEALFSEESEYAGADLTDKLDGVREFVEQCLSEVSGVRALRIIQDGKNQIELTASELGIGVGQVIPLLGAAAGLHDQTILIEQPEIHLHPKQQADLGQIFAQSAKENGNRFVVETHSIHILERLGKMIRETASGDPRDGVSLNPEDIGVYFVDSSLGSAKLIKIELTPNGRLDGDFPDEFFNEDYNDLR